MNDFPEYESFRHGLVTSKLWLCEELEKVTDLVNYREPTCHILASWHNLLAFMLLVRKPKYYKQVFSYDINPDYTIAANKLCDAWLFDKPTVKNITVDINLQHEYALSTENIFINCSVDQIDKLTWYDNIPKGNVVCLQTTNLNDTEYPWYIKTVTSSIDEFKNLFPMEKILYKGTKSINYNTWGYDRFMLIGIR